MGDIGGMFAHGAVFALEELIVSVVVVDVNAVVVRADYEEVEAEFYL